MDSELKKLIYILIAIKLIIIIIVFLAPLSNVSNWRYNTNSSLDGFAQFDTLAYLDIVENGYNSNFANGNGNYGFYPLYPLLIKIFSFIFGFHLSAFLISNISSFLAVIMIYLLVRVEFNKKTAYKTCFYLILFPTTYFLTMMYTESLFLLLSVSCFYFAKKNNWVLSGLLGFFASMTRIQGFLLMFPMIYMYLKTKEFNIKKIDKNIILMFLVPLGIIVFFSYLYLVTGNFLIHFNNHEGYGRAITFPGLAIVRTITYDFTVSPSIMKYFYYPFNIFMTIMFLYLIYKSYYKLKKEYTIFFGLSFLMPLMSSSLQAIARFEIVMFPAFMVLALIENKNKYIKLLYAIFFILMIMFTFWHTLGGLKIAGFN